MAGFYRKAETVGSEIRFRLASKTAIPGGRNIEKTKAHLKVLVADKRGRPLGPGVSQLDNTWSGP